MNKDIEVEIFQKGQWQTCGFLQLSGGRHAPSQFFYDHDYTCNNLFSDSRDAQVSVNCPIEFTEYKYEFMAPFASDLLPNGMQRAHLQKKFGINNEADFLRYGVNHPIGNLRTAVHPDWKFEVFPFEIEDVSLENEKLREIAALKGGTDLQGDAPKIMAVRNGAGEWFVDNGHVEGDHYIVKFPRGNHKSDFTILSSEYKYIHLADRLGLNVVNKEEYFYLDKGALGIPRFDFVKGLRYGVESLYSVMGLAGGDGLKVSQYDACQSLYKFAGVESVIEYVKRDIVNFVYGNTDNHGRNTSVIKTTDEVKLAPLYDFAPMILDRALIIRTFVWGNEENSVQVDWNTVIHKLQDLLQEKLPGLNNFAEMVYETKAEMLQEFEIDELVREKI
ncbi:MAG: HipA domain-containing protein [Lentisphaeraceae bacterium]|nr:HipA domain-containing protein [Lentisphaeraceae bacterium]